jgi:very-short-patch-repair endonuclease
VRRTGIRIHHVDALERHDIRRIDGIPITSPARTLLDAATVLPPYLLERAIAEAQVRRLVRKRDLLHQLAKHPRRAGTRSLRRLLDDGPAVTRSEAERRLLKLIRAAELPIPDVNVWVAGIEVDFFWPEHKLVVETDGFRYHSSRRAFERDRGRDAALAACGYAVIRITWRQLVDAPEAVIARIAAALAVRA